MFGRGSWRAVAAATVFVGASLLFGAVDRGRSSSLTAAAARILRDPMDVFENRSPGERQAGALTQTKPRFASILGPGPHERVLSVVRDRPPGVGPFPDEFAFDPLADTPLGLGTMPPGAIGVPESFAGPTGTGSPPPSTGPFYSPFGGVPNEKQQSTDTDNSVQPASAIPEPTTWAMMIGGFAFVALSLRRARRARAAVLRLNGKR